MDDDHGPALNEIHGLRRRLEAAENAGDVDVIAGLFAEDAVLMVPTFPVQEGAAACAGFIRGLLPALLAQFHRPITYTSAEVRVDGDRALDRGRFAFSATPRDGGSTNHETGKYLWLYERGSDGRWKLWRAILTLDEANSQEAHTVSDGRPSWPDKAARLSAALALPVGVFLSFAEVVRNWSAWSFWPFWLVDYIAVALLLVGWHAGRTRWPHAQALLCGAWGFTCAMFYMSFFSHVATIDQPDHGPVPHHLLTIIVGALFALSVIAFTGSIVAGRTEARPGGR